MASDSENIGSGDRRRWAIRLPPATSSSKSTLSTSLLVLRSSSSSSLEEQLQPPSQDDHGDRAEGRWLGPGSLDRCSSSSEQSLVESAGNGDRGVASSEQRWSSASSANIYENVLNSRGVGTLGPQREPPAAGYGYGKLRKCEENIYENICEDCGRLYSAAKCGFCDDDEEPEHHEPSQRSRKLSKYSAKFQEFFGNFRLKPLAPKPSNTIQPSKRKLSKSDIVHNVRGFEDVYRTNKSFDLGEICRMRDDELVLLSSGRTVISSTSGSIGASDCEESDCAVNMRGETCGACVVIHGGNELFGVFVISLFGH